MPKCRALVASALAVLLSVACRSVPTLTEIPQSRAVEIARKEITFEPTATEVHKKSSGGRGVWRVEFRGRLPGQPPMLFETRIIEIDRVTGEVVSVTRS